MWFGELKKQGVPVVYFDAFENDFSDDIFFTVVGEIINLENKNKKSTDDLKSSALKLGKIVSKKVPSVALEIFVRSISSGLLRTDDLQNVGDSIAKLSGEVLDTYIAEHLGQGRAKRQALEEFRNRLREIPIALSKIDSEGGIKPLIFIVDELDRCRPSFSLELLEIIKHFFQVENVHFVPGVHMEQLKNSVKVTYGPDIDAQLYLQKFIDLIFNFLKYEERSHASDVTKII